MHEHTTKDLVGKFILFATILASGMAFLDGTVVTIAIPVIQSKLHATVADIQWIVNGYALFLAALILISGALGDRFGRRKVFLYGIGIFTIASFLCGMSFGITQLVLFRVLQGIGASLMVPGSLSIINVSFKESVRGKAIGMWSGFAGGVAALGPFLGGWLVQTYGWSSIFFINIPLGILAFFITLRYVPETKNDSATRIDTQGALYIFLSLFGIVYGLIRGPENGWDILAVGSLIAGITFLLLFIRVEMQVKEPLVPFSLFKSSLVTGANLATLFLYAALYGVIFFLVLNFQQVQHYSPLLAGLGMLPTILLITFLSGIGGTLADKIGPRIPMIVGPLLVSCAMVLFILPARHANYFLGYMPGLILFGLGMAIVIAPLTKSALSVESKFSGAASGINNAVARIAGLLAVALFGVIMVSFFKSQLHTRLTTSLMQPVQMQQIITQENKMGAIEIPHTFGSTTKTIAQNAIEDSFVYAFDWVMASGAMLAFLSAVISYFTINPKKANVTIHDLTKRSSLRAPASPRGE